jgi:simple sugar transport system permease protein
VGVFVSALFSLLFAFVTLTLQANQVAAGLSLTILGAGLTAVLGRSYVGFGAAVSFSPMPIPYLASLPVLGASLFSLNLLGYLCILLLGVIIWFLQRTRGGLALKAVGESPIIARSLGLPVTLIRYLAVLVGGAMSGLAGSYYSIAQFKMWQDNLTSGSGWIALALVVFATWRPWRAAIGALLFGSVTALGLYFQAIGVKVSTFALASLPYAATILVLVILSSNQENIRRHAPAWLGKPFHDAS